MMVPQNNLNIGDEAVVSCRPQKDYQWISEFSAGRIKCDGRLLTSDQEKQKAALSPIHSHLWA